MGSFFFINNTIPQFILPRVKDNGNSLVYCTEIQLQLVTSIQGSIQVEEALLPATSFSSSR